MPDADTPLTVVTGAGAGIGAAIAEDLIGRGHEVLGVDLSGTSPAQHHLQLDLGAPDAGEQVASRVGDRPVRALVNNAAVADYSAALDTSLEVWDRVVDVNLRAVFLVSRAMYQGLAMCGGAIVNVASVHASATSVGVAAYAASKGGVVALTRALALEWASAGIRVNCVLPGAVDTPMLAAGLHRTDATLESLGSKHPIGRVGQPGEIARAVAFLLGDEAAFVTGTSLVVDGGALARLSTE